jgi:hypothetical protein
MTKVVVDFEALPLEAKLKAYPPDNRVTERG